MQIDKLTEINEDFSQLDEWFQENTCTFKNVYVSFGSKFNVHQIRFNYPDSIKLHTHYTNAVYQMVPTFIRYPDQEDAVNLAIVIDDFHRPESLQTNMTYLTNQLNDIGISVHVLLINKNVSSQNIHSCLRSITDYVEKNSVDPHNVMFTNYIRFQHPNIHETRLEERIGPAMRSSLKSLHEGKYANRLYQWYGAMFYYYNYIYLYDGLAEIRMSNKMRLQSCVFEQIIPHSHLDPFAYDKIEQIVAKNTHFHHIWHDFKKTSIDITKDYII
jgi:hypothetical protein